MAGIAALRTGAGLATLLVPRSLNGVFETLALETMSVPLPETPRGTLAESALETISNHLPGKKGLIIGPGLGTAPETGRLVNRLVQECELPLVIDADGLNSLAGETSVLRHLHTPAILTPHPGEMARLTARTVDEIQQDRVACAREFAQAFNVHVVLKGARTVIAHPDGRVFINPTGNPGMASGGMGDVLAGIIGGWIAQGQPAEAAAHLGVYLHGAAADTLSGTQGPFGYLASDLLACLPHEISTLSEWRPKPPLCLQQVDG
jgi:NAD(P)H-hydrate epimerase